jgi:hypothetical protein
VLAGLSESTNVQGIFERRHMEILRPKYLGTRGKEALQCFKWDHLANSIIVGSHSSLFNFQKNLWEKNVGQANFEEDHDGLLRGFGTF